MQKNYGKRIGLCVLALCLYGFGNFLGVKAGGAGTNAWNTLNLGLAGKTGFSFGTINMIVGLVIIAIDFLGKGKIGLGTILNMFVISVATDVYLRVLSFWPAAENGVLGAILTLAGQTVSSFATILYMKPALGCGPRDTLLVGLAKRTRRLPIGGVSIALLSTATLIGWLLGGPVGAGTLICAFATGPIMQAAFRSVRFDATTIRHQRLAETAGVFGIIRRRKAEV